MKKRRFETLDLTGYMNGKIVHDAKSGLPFAGLGGNAFNESGFFPFGVPFTDESGVPFVFARKDGLDNLTAKGQTLTVRGMYRTAYFAGFMYWGAEFDYITLVYEDGTADERKLCFDDWSHRRDVGVNMMRMLDVFDSVRVLKQCISYGAQGAGYKGPLFVYSYPVALRADRSLNAIVLPDNDFLHLFAVTLEAAE